MAESRVQWIQHKGRTILLIDATSLPPAEGAKVLLDARKRIATLGPKSALTLTDVTGSLFDDAAAKEAQACGAANAPFVKAAALVGVKGLKKIVLTAIVRATGRELQLFETRDQALEWLALR